MVRCERIGAGSKPAGHPTKQTGCREGGTAGAERCFASNSRRVQFPPPPRLGCLLGRRWTPNPTSEVRSLDDPRTEGAAKWLATGSEPLGYRESVRRSIRPPSSIWRVRLPARSSAFQAGETGSTPVRATASLSSSPAQDAWFSTMKRGFESRKRHDGLASGSGAETTNLGCEGSIPSGASDAGAPRWTRSPHQAFDDGSSPSAGTHASELRPMGGPPSYKRQTGVRFPQLGQRGE
jgi:hypothetical protein